ncbi:MAG: hypothetical protein RL733_827, partial [Actinomycetota bacterium]
MSNSPISKILDNFIEEGIKLSPIGATMLGVPGHDDRFDDFSMAGYKKQEELARNTLKAIQAETPINEFDRIAKDVAIERLSSELKLSESLESNILFNLIASPVTRVRQVFEMMNKEKPETISNVTKRLNAVEEAFTGWRSALTFGAEQGKVNSRRQVLATAGQLETFSKGAFAAVAKKFDPSGSNQELIAAAQRAEKASGDLAKWLRDEYAPKSDPKDGVGAERYQMWARHFTGADLDLRDTYDWGIEQLKMINDRMWVAAKKLYPDA